MSSALPQEMEQHTYAIMNRVEDSHWWFVGRRAILESFLQGIIEKINAEKPRILVMDLSPDQSVAKRILSRLTIRLSPKAQIPAQLLLKHRTGLACCDAMSIGRPVGCRG